MKKRYQRRVKPSEIDSPDELLNELTAMFPEYESEFDRDPSEVPLSFHAVLTDFIYFFGKNISAFNEGRLRNFGSLINDAVEAGGQLENAFGTCLLEHLSQIRGTKPLISYLSNEAKKRLHA